MAEKATARRIRGLWDRLYITVRHFGEDLMAYYFRAFCTAEHIPTLAEVLAWTAEHGVTLAVDPGDTSAGVDTPEWGDTAIGLIYAQDKAPFYVEIDKNDGPDSLAAQEINEFLATLQTLKKSRKRDRVIEQLQKTRFIVPCQIPIEDFDDAGFHALDVLLAYFLVNSGGMVQADGQGFYEMGKIIVELE
jgi:hypothetical protein